MNNKTEIILFVDRSGSMYSILKDAQGGLDNYLDEQQKVPGECNVTIIAFDTGYEVPVNCVPISEAAYRIDPRGGTALYDALGRGINEVGVRLSNMPESERPNNVLVAIITDGQENASREYTSTQVKDMIEHQTSKYGWVFTYLGANQDAFHESASIGISAGQTLNYVGPKSMEAYSAMSKSTTALRSGESFSYSDNDRNSAI